MKGYQEWKLLMIDRLEVTQKRFSTISINEVFWGYEIIWGKLQDIWHKF